MSNLRIPGVKSLLKCSPMIAGSYRRLEDLRTLRRQPVETPFGFSLVGDRSMELGVFEPLETRFFRDVIKNYDRFINIGANVGYYCCHALQVGLPVVAFEPVELNLQLLMRNISCNGWADRIELHPVALSDRIGVQKIYGGGTGASLIEGWAGVENTYSSHIPCNTLNSLIGHKFVDERCLVLVDVEGAELSMLRGATQLVERENRPDWIVEISINEHLPEGQSINPHLLECFDVFWRAGYLAQALDAELREVKRDEVVRICDTGINTLDVHNFLFTALDSN